VYGDPYSKYGLWGGQPSSTPTELNAVATPTEGGDPDKLLSLANPMTAFLAIGVIALGFAAFSTTVRVGNSSASLNLGK
jgi:hypothetical protein